MPVLGDEWGRRSRCQDEGGGKLVRHLLEQVAPTVHDLGRLFAGVKDGPTEHNGTDRVQSQLKFRDHSEVAAATPEGPEQLRILRLGGMHDLSVSGDKLNGEQVVAGKPILADQMADAAAQCKAADTGAGNQPTGGRQPVLLAGRVERLPRGPSTSERPLRLNLNLNLIQLCEVDDDPVVTAGEAGNTVRTAAYRDRHSFTSGKRTVRATSSVEAACTISAGRLLIA